MKSALALILVSLALSSTASAQRGNLGGPLPPVPVPNGNPLTPSKVRLGKTLFWDEQLSSTRTMACGTCHIPSAGSSDPRLLLGLAIHPGPDGSFGTPDDVAGSPGVPANAADGRYLGHRDFGLDPQVTSRRAMPLINAAYVNELFWDGRAPSSFTDPESGTLLLRRRAALESQAIVPVLSEVEMGHENIGFPEFLQRIEDSDPLALASDIPAPLEAWLGQRSYPELFEEAFGSSDITAAAFAQAVASYERTLTSDQTPLRAFMDGMMGALTPPERNGLQVFQRSNCASCHGGPRLTDDSFRYTGVRPAREDLGRFLVTGATGDRGRMKVPSLLNLELRAPYFHNGGMATIAEVVDFYDRGGDFSAPNLSPLIRPLNLSPRDKRDLVAFLGRPLTDRRVRDARPPFDRPTLFTEGDQVPQPFGAGTPGPMGRQPELVALEPAKIGNPSMTLGIQGARGGGLGVLLLGSEPDLAGRDFRGLQLHVEGADLVHRVVRLNAPGPGRGFATLSLSVPDELALVGKRRYAQWLVFGGQPLRPLAATDAVEIVAF